MKIIGQYSQLRIKAKASLNVKLTLALVVALGGSYSELQAAPRSVANSDERAAQEADTIDETLPKIEVKRFDVSTVRHTRSGAVYLFKLTGGETPQENRIFLLKKESTKAMAFRSLRLYLTKNELAARKVRAYSGYSSLGSGEKFNAIEKISDLEQYANTAQDQAELLELEGGGPPPPNDASAPDLSLPADSAPPVAAAPAELPLPDADSNTEPPLPEGADLKPSEIEALGPLLDYDPQLDAESSPPPAGAVDSTDARGRVEKFTPEGPQVTEDDMSGISVEEIVPLEPNPFALLGGIGNIRAGDNAVYPAGGFKFSFRLAKMLFLNKPRLQDSFAGEVGLYFGKIIITQTDVYDMLPFSFTGRYNVHVSEELSFFAYTGLTRHVVFPNEGYTLETFNKMNIFMPAIGLGVIVRVGPSWDVRVDLGYDLLGFGLALNF